MSLFRTLAAGLFDGAAVTITNATKIKTIARTAGAANGSWDLTMQDPIPKGKVVVHVTPQHIANHNLTPDYSWDANGTVLTVSLRDDLAALTDATFGVTIERCGV